jgi:hypothetical protein
MPSKAIKHISSFNSPDWRYLARPVKNEFGLIAS